MSNCIVCGNQKLDRVIRLGNHPVADTFLKEEKVFESHKRYPLNCVLCSTCGHLQNEFVVSPEERYIENEYSYTASNSKISRDHWQEYCDTLSQYLSPKDHVIEFGSNDGLLLSYFQKKGALVTGIDPSPAMVALAKKRGIYTIRSFLRKESLKIAVKRHGKAKIICGNNVFNHIANLNEVMASVTKALRSDGYFVFESPYHKDIIEKYLFDTIYHEHISYFSVRSVDFLFRNHGLYITNIEHNLYHGGCIRVYASPGSDQYNKRLVAQYIKGERALLSKKTYVEFVAKIENDKFNVLKLLYTLKSKSKRIAVIGAATKGNTLMNYYGLDSGIIDFVTDSSPQKIGKYTPGSLIPIVGDEMLKKIDVGLIVSWNIGKYLAEKIKKINKNIQLVVPGEKKLL